MILVHGPFVPTPDSADRTCRDEQGNYEDMVAYMDRSIGKIVAQLEELNLAKNTLLLFTGDNGTPRQIRSNLDVVQIRGGKGSTTDAGTRVPLIGYWPGKMPASKVCEDLVDFSDVLPTIAQVAGAELPKGAILDGVSFAPQLLSEQGTPREAIYCYYWPTPLRGSTKKAKIFARDKRWKLYADGNLFDVSNDVLEKNPVEGNPEIRRTLQKVIDSMPKEGQRIRKGGKSTTTGAKR